MDLLYIKIISHFKLNSSALAFVTRHIIEDNVKICDSISYDVGNSLTSLITRTS